MDALATRLETWSDRINPILVRETRQRIKGKFFPATFLLLVGICWLICVGTILSIGSEAGMAELGPKVLSSLILLLGIPLCYAAPLNLYRSISQEFEGQTYEVLAITTLSPRHIVFGKLQSCMIEVGAYSCAVAPFICFSYLLRGVSIFGLLSSLAVMHFASAINSLAAMLLGAIAKQTFLQAVAIILLMIVCTISLTIATNLAYETLFRSVLRSEEVIQGLVCFVMAALFGGVFSVAVAISQYTPTRLQPYYGPPREGSLSSTQREGALANPFGSRLDDERRQKHQAAGNSAPQPDEGSMNS